MDGQQLPVGFRSVSEEYEATSLPVEGTIPSWLSGSLIRNGPGQFEYGDTRVNHWFDGLAMLRRYQFSDGTVSYTNRFLRSEAYRDRLTGPDQQFGSSSTLARAKAWLKAMGPPAPTDNANVHVLPVGPHYVALTETPRQLVFDPETLETDGELQWNDAITEHIATAHHTIDPVKEEAIGFGIEFGTQSKYHIYRILPASGRREQIGTVGARRPAYIHDCAVTEQYVILVETPLEVQLLKSLLPWGDGLVDALSYDETADTRFLIVDRERGELVADPVDDPFFTFHHVNAYEDDGSIVVDLVAFEDASIVNALGFDQLASGGFDSAPTGSVRRYRLPVDGAGPVTWSRQYTGGAELPTVPRAVRTQPYQYAYAQATDREGANGLVKLNVETGRAIEWWEQGVYIEEPRMVQHPNATEEDHGVIIAPAVDVSANQGLLLIFDAETLTERARATTPHVPPFGFHGRFIPA